MKVRTCEDSLDLDFLPHQLATLACLGRSRYSNVHPHPVFKHWFLSSHYSIT